VPVKPLCVALVVIALSGPAGAEESSPFVPPEAGYPVIGTVEGCGKTLPVTVAHEAGMEGLVGETFGAFRGGHAKDIIAALRAACDASPELRRQMAERLDSARVAIAPGADEPTPFVAGRVLDIEYPGGDIDRRSFARLLRKALAAPSVAKPSFDCAKAGSPAEKLVCAEPDLAHLDAALAEDFRAALAAAKGDGARVAALRQAQRQWLAERDRTCLAGRDLADAAATSAAVHCLGLAYLARDTALSSTATPAPAAAAAPAITALQDDALAAAYPQLRAVLEVEEGRLSADGKFLAFALSQIVSGDADQVWLYELAAGKLRPVTETPVKGVLGFTINDMAFAADDTLYVDAERIDWRDQSANRTLRLAATMAETREIDAFPEAAAAVLARQQAAYANAQNDGDREESNQRYTVSVANQGHGAFALTARRKDGGAAVLTVRGSWDLAHFVFDAQHSRVLYADNDTAGRIVRVYELETTRGAQLALPVARPLAVTAAGLLAYSAYAGCTPGGAWPPPDHTVKICFVSLP
jgi:uncharacterized protein